MVVAGEALVDLVPDGGAVLREHAGGGPFNTARAIARLGGSVAFLGGLSTDRHGRWLRRLLGDDGVDLRAVVDTDDPTTLALADVDGDGQATYRFYTQGTAAAGLTAETALAALPASARVVCAGGLGLAVEPVAAAMEALVESARPAAMVVVDPNCRPGVAADERAYRERLGRGLGVAGGG